MNAEERLQKIAELMQDMEPVSAAAEELRHKIMELLPPPPGLIRPEDADVNTVYRVKCDGAECAGWRCDPEDKDPWLLSTGGRARDDEVTILGRADLPEGAPLVLNTSEDYLNAPVGTIILMDGIGMSPWQKFATGKWVLLGATERWDSEKLAAEELPRRVIRWGMGDS